MCISNVFRKHFRLSVCLLLSSAAIIAAPPPAAAQLTFPNLFPFLNAHGLLQTFSTNGGVDLTGAFFQSLGTNGRTCASCHQPDQGWTVSADHIQNRFDVSQGLDPIFRTNDGSNCDHNINTATLDGRRQAYSLLRTRGLIRIALQVPAGAEFDVVNVNNPYGCNETNVISVYRRPLPSTNLRFLSAVMWDARESSTQTGTQKITFELQNPGPILLADLAHQATDATLGHAQAAVAPTAAQLQDIVNFEVGLYTAQGVDFNAGQLRGPLAGGATGGPVSAVTQQFFVGINDPIDPLGLNLPNLGFNPFHNGFTAAIFGLFGNWANSQPVDFISRARASIARGEVVFNTKPVQISGVSGLNDELGIPVVSGNCGTCHDSPNIGSHSFPAPLNIGVGDLTSSLDVGYLPVITLHNRTTGAIVQTTDPGRALITGSWKDIGRLKGPVLRGLASRAPYFHNGSADTLLDVVNFYEKRFAVDFTAQEKTDLIAFLNAL